MARKEGSLGGEMRMRINAHCKSKSNKTRRNYLKACASFDRWRKESGISNRVVRSNPKSAVEKWRDALRNKGYAASTIHSYIAGVTCGLQIEMTGITPHGTSENKTKSLGRSARAKAASERENNTDIVRFQMMVGGRRTALSRLRGNDLILDESGELCVQFIKDKGGKTQLQRILPEYQDAVCEYFTRVAPDELLFPHIDRDLDLHFLRAQNAKAAYQFYQKLCSTPEGRAEVRRQLWARYTDPEIGCAAFLKAKERGDTRKMDRLRYLFEQEMKPGKYHLRGANRRIALARRLPTEYDRLATLAVSVFMLSHWRSETTVKHYFL